MEYEWKKMWNVIVGMIFEKKTGKQTSFVSVERRSAVPECGVGMDFVFNVQIIRLRFPITYFDIFKFFSAVQLQWYFRDIIILNIYSCYAIYH